MIFFNKKAQEKEKQNETSVIEDKTLILLLDNPKAGIISYLSQLGIEVKSLHTDVETLNMSLLSYTTEDKCRVVVVDSGTGKFTSKEAEYNLYGLIDLLNPSIFSLTVLSTNKSFFKFVKNTVNNINTSSETALNVDYVPYETIKTLVDTLKSYPERYMEKGAEDTVIAEPLKYKGKFIGYYDRLPLSFSDFSTLKDITLQDTSDTRDIQNSIRAFKVVI
jgi:hypothetical protein